MADIDIEAPGADEADLNAALQDILFLNLPTSDPNVAGRIWNDGGFVKVSSPGGGGGARLLTIGGRYLTIGGRTLTIGS